MSISLEAVSSGMPPPGNRRRFLAALIALPVVFGATMPAWSADKVKVRFGVLGGSSIAALVAQDEGLFAARDIEVEFVPLQSGPAAIAATISGSVDLSYGDILAWVSGLGNGFTNVRLIVPANGPAASSLLVKQDSPIQGPADLKGKRVGTPGAPAFSIATKIWFEENGVSPADIQFVVLPPSSEGQSLVAGSVDAALAFSDLNVLNASRQLPVRSVSDPVTGAVPSGATFASYYANAAFIEANGEAVERIAAVLHEGAKRFNAFTPEQKLAFNGKYAGWDVTALAANHPGFLDTFRFTEVQTSALDLTATQAWIDKAFKTGGLPKQVDIAPYVHATAVAATE